MSISNYMSLVLKSSNKPLVLLFSTRYENGALMTIEALAAYRELTEGIEYQTTTWAEIDADAAALGPYGTVLTEYEVRIALMDSVTH